MTMDINKATRAFGALSQETRLNIYRLLANSGESGMPAGDIALTLGVPQNTLSFHLSALHSADLIRSRRLGRFIIYSINPGAMKDLLHYLVEQCSTGK